MAVILKWGAFLSAGVILLGLFLLLAKPGHGGEEDLVSLRAIWSGLRSGNPNAIIMGGLLVLLATPIVRVAASVAAFVVRRERWHILISIAVLVILIISMAIGKGH